MANILIIDDDDVYAGMLEQRLLRAGHQVSVHVGPFGSTAAARKPGLDLVVLDVFMPGLDGPTLLEVMRRDNSAPRPRVVFCSSMDPEALGALASRHQASGYFPKSAARQQVIESIEAALQKPHTSLIPK
jgi:DNA-binding NarL/FixJ family response regulator